MKTKKKILASVKTWLVIYPSITLFLLLFGSSMAVLPLYLRTLILTIVLVPWMVFAGIPLLEFLLQAFLKAKANKKDMPQAQGPIFKNIKDIL